MPGPFADYGRALSRTRVHARIYRRRSTCIRSNCFSNTAEKFLDLLINIDILMALETLSSLFFFFGPSRDPKPTA